MIGREPLPENTAHDADAAQGIALDSAINPFVKQGVAYWRSLRGQRRFPARGELTLRGMAPFLPHVVILGVIENGADFEYRYVGEAQRQAFKTSFKGLRVSQIEAMLPPLGALLRAAYEPVRALGLPFVIRGRVDHEPVGSKFLYHETAFLPLGVSDETVDHILIVGVQIPEPFWDIPKETLTVLAEQLRVGVA